MPLQRARAAGRCAAPPPPRAARRPRRAGPEPQPPASRHGRRPPTTSPSRGATWLPRTPPPPPIPRMTATRQGTFRIQAAHSAARSLPPSGLGRSRRRPTLARTRTGSTGRSAPVQATSSSQSSLRWARMAWRSAWLSGRTDPLGRSSRRRGKVEGSPSGAPFCCARRRPARAEPTPLLRRSVPVGGIGGRLEVAAAAGGALLGLDPLDGRAGPLPIGPPGWVARLRAEGPVRVDDLVGAPVVLDLGGGLAPGPQAPGRLRHRTPALPRTHSRGGPASAARPVTRRCQARVRTTCRYWGPSWALASSPPAR